MENFYVEINNDIEVSLLLQKRAFECDYGWFSGGKKLRETKAKYLFFDDKKDITWDDELTDNRNKYTLDQALDYFRKLKEENEKPKFKVGDNVFVEWLKHDWSKLGIEVGRIYKINKNYDDIDYCFDNVSGGAYNFPTMIRFRHLTPEEIKASQKIKFKGHNVEMLSGYKGYIKIGCRTFADDAPKEILHIMNAFGLDKVNHPEVGLISKEELESLNNWIEKQ